MMILPLLNRYITFKLFNFTCSHSLIVSAFSFSEALAFSAFFFAASILEISHSALAFLAILGVDQLHFLSLT